MIKNLRKYQIDTRYTSKKHNQHSRPTNNTASALRHYLAIKAAQSFIAQLNPGAMPTLHTSQTYIHCVS